MKRVGLALPDPTKMAPETWTASCFITGHLILVLRGQEEFRTADHTSYTREGREEARNRNAMRPEEAMAETLEGDPVQVSRHLRWAKKIGAWLRV